MTTILNGDCRDVLKTLPDESVHCCVTSPPYWGLRDYGHPGQIGLEPTPEAYVAELVAVFREVRRVLRSDGVCWLNLGDSYASQGGPQVSQAKQHNGSGFHGTNRNNSNLKPKDLVGIPWRVAFALQADGWYLRQDIIWAKPNPMPESVTDRCTKAHEYIFLLTKSARYFYDVEAIKEQATNAGKRVSLGEKSFSKGQASGAGVAASGNGLADHYDVPEDRNRRSVWTVATQPYSGAHFATFPPALIEPMILAGCPAQACPTCGKGWERVVEKPNMADRPRRADTSKGVQNSEWQGATSAGQKYQEWRNANPDRTLGHRPACACPPADPVPGVTLDPFGGSGTTGQVASRLGRKAILIELNPEYLPLVNQRTAQAGLNL